jgi:hypothetical protein
VEAEVKRLTKAKSAGSLTQVAMTATVEAYGTQTGEQEQYGPSGRAQEV